MFFWWLIESLVLEYPNYVNNSYLESLIFMELAAYLSFTKMKKIQTQYDVQ